MNRGGDTGNRLYKIRFIAGFGEDGQQKAYATESQLNFPEKSYSQWETGRIQIPVSYALRLIEYLPGLTLDYIYRGDLDFVTPEMGRRLRAAPDRPLAKRGRKPKA